MLLGTQTVGSALHVVHVRPTMVNYLFSVNQQKGFSSIVHTSLMLSTYIEMVEMSLQDWIPLTVGPGLMPEISLNLCE